MGVGSSFARATCRLDLRRYGCRMVADGPGFWTFAWGRCIDFEAERVPG
jgi:hypothetical protein